MVPEKYLLYQNYPNPFNPSTKIRFELPKPETVKIEIFDILGRKVKTLLDKQMPAGVHEVDFIASDLSSGMYFYKLKTESYSITKKMILLR